MKKQKISAKTVALLAMMIALALVFSYVETLIPINFGIPGVKLGLANLVIVAALYLIGGKEAFLVSVVRIFLSGFMFGNLASIMYSLAGGLLSLAVMLILKKTDKLSILAVSVLGGICHNIGQLIVAILVAFGIMLINIVGAKTAAKLQTILTIIIGGAGILLIVASVINGTVDNLDGQMFAEVGGGGIVKSILSVAVISPFYLIGFDVIPQAAEEINVPPKKIGGMLILSVVLAVLFYAFVIIAVGLVMNSGTITASQAGTGLVTADAMALAFKTSVMAKVIIVGGMCGIITSWNSFMIGGSRAIYSMAESYMIPRVFAKLHPKHKTPINALILIGILTMLAPFAGRVMMVWICDAGNFGCCLAYCMVAISFLILRKKQPDMPRPYKVPAGRLMGGVAVLMSGFMVVMYCIPGSGGTLILPEWGMVAAWSALGVVFFAICKSKYRESFGSMVQLISDEDAATLLPEADERELDKVIDGAIDRVLARLA